VIELVAGDEGEDLGEGELDAGAVVDGGQLELRLGGVDPMVARGGAARGVVVVAELFAAQGGGAAAAARGEDVTAEETLGTGCGGFGCVWRWIGFVLVHRISFRENLKKAQSIQNIGQSMGTSG
jgi:hypothetical protein